MKFLILFSVFFLSACSEKQSEVKEVLKNDSVSPHKLINIAIVDEATKYLDVKKVLEAAYKEVGYEIKFSSFPAKRSLYEAQNNENIDAEFGRVKQAEPQLSNLIRIPVPFMQIKLQAIVRPDFDLRLSNIKDLGKYKCGTKRGSVAVEKMIESSKGTLYNTAEASIKALKAGRVDVIVLLSQSKDQYLKELEGVKVVDLPLEKMNIYHFINKRHKNLVEGLTKAFIKVTGNQADQSEFE